MPMVSYATVTVTVTLTDVRVLDDNYDAAVREALDKVKVDPAAARVTAVTVQKQ